MSDLAFLKRLFGGRVHDGAPKPPEQPQRNAAADLYRRKQIVLCVPLRVSPNPGREEFLFGAQPDYDLPSFSAAADGSDQQIGAAIRKALEASLQTRESKIYDGGGFKRKGFIMDPGTMIAYDPEENDKLARLFGLGSRRGLFAGMRNVIVRRELDRIAFFPSWRDRTTFRDFREGAEGVEPVIVSASLNDDHLGAAARCAFARSSG